MARPSATAALLVLLVSVLAVAHCRPIEAEPATDAESAAVATVISDDNGPPNPAEAAGAADVALPAEQLQHGFLRLPSHRVHRHRPCRHGPFHRHLWWARHHGAFGFGDDAPRRFHHRRHIEVPSHLPILPADEARETEEVKAVAEPDPDRSLADGEGEVVARTEPSFGDADGAAAHEDEGAAVREWRKEMRRRWFQFHHHGMRLHRPHHHDVEEGHEQEEEAAEGLKRFHHHHRHDEDDEDEKHMTRKRFRHAEHDADGDSDDEDDEVEELVRRFRKAIMRRRFGGHGRRFHHRHHHFGGHRHAEEAEKVDAQEDGGVVSWIKGLMNQF